ncbi:MAG: pyridoxal phosphate-dependent aminotransferase [Bacteroidales bacterium]|jgi:aspartate aminotransferase|nr:pyridoxal phosphate-dependent aminotransferase [Bacteroidales bacterium]
MPRISDRGFRMPASPIRKLAQYAEEAKQRGIDVLHLNIGQPDITTPKHAIDSIKNFSDPYISYSNSAGNLSLRKELVEYYKTNDIDISHKDILITTGGSEAICFAYYSILNYGDEVIVPEPFYSNYYGFTTETGARMIPVRSTIENGFALPEIEEFEKVLTPRTKAIMLCNPNNPTGYVYSRHELERIRDIVLENDLFLICDEVYREFCYDNDHYSVMNLSGIEDNVILVDSFSKRYNVCGIRIGALISRNKEVISTSLKFAQARLSPPSLGQIVAEALLKTPQEYLDKAFEEYKSRRDFVIHELNTIKGVYSPIPKGAFYSIVELPVDNAEKFCQWLLEEFEYKGTTVMLAPGNGFYTGKKLGERQVRLAYVLNKEKLALAVECLKKALEIYPGNLLK